MTFATEPVTGDEPVTWRELDEVLEDILGLNEPDTSPEAVRLEECLRKISTLGATADQIDTVNFRMGTVRVHGKCYDIPSECQPEFAATLSAYLDSRGLTQVATQVRRSANLTDDLMPIHLSMEAAPMSEKTTAERLRELLDAEDEVIDLPLSRIDRIVEGRFVYEKGDDEEYYLIENAENRAEIARLFALYQKETAVPDQSADKIPTRTVKSRVMGAIKEGAKRAPVELALEEGQALLVKHLLRSYRGSRTEKNAVKKFLIQFFSSPAGQVVIASGISAGAPFVAGWVGKEGPVVQTVADEFAARAATITTKEGMKFAFRQLKPLLSVFSRLFDSMEKVSDGRAIEALPAAGGRCSVIDLNPEPVKAKVTRS